MHSKAIAYFIESPLEITINKTAIAALCDNIVTFALKYNGDLQAYTILEACDILRAHVLAEEPLTLDKLGVYLLNKPAQDLRHALQGWSKLPALKTYLDQAILTLPSQEDIHTETQIEKYLLSGISA